MSVTHLGDVASAPGVRPNTTYEPERRCTHVDDEGNRCITRLCRMNAGPDCYAHSGRRIVQRDPQIPRELQAVA